MPEMYDLTMFYEENTLIMVNGREKYQDIVDNVCAVLKVDDLTYGYDNQNVHFPPVLLSELPDMMGVTFYKFHKNPMKVVKIRMSCNNKDVTQEQYVLTLFPNGTYPDTKFICGFVDHSDLHLQNWRAK